MSSVLLYLPLMLIGECFMQYDDTPYFFAYKKTG